MKKAESLQYIMLGAKDPAMETKSRASSLKKKRKIFGWLFLASILVFFASIMLFTLAPMATPPESAPPQPNGGQKESTPEPPPAQAPRTFLPGTAVVVAVVSLLTSITSLVGLFSTTVLAWRKEKREKVSSELEIKKKELELEKLRQELAKSEESRNNESA